MLIALWILNALLAVVFLASGATKVARPREALAGSGMKWALDFPSPTVKLIGALEIIGAFGLILPMLLGVAPILTPLSSIGLAVIMIGAVVVHARRKENAAIQIVLAVLTLVSAALGFAVLA